jgi:hypothetical protein
VECYRQERGERLPFAQGQSAAVAAWFDALEGKPPLAARRRASSSDARASGRFQEEGRLGTTMAGDQGQPVYIGGCPWPTPRQGCPSKAVAGRGSLVGVSRRGLPCQASSAMRRAAAPASGVPGPRLVHTPSEPSGSQRSPAVSSGTSFAQATDAILGKQALGRTLIRMRSRVHGRPPAAITNTARRSCFSCSR